LPAGTVLPASRRLAAQLGVSRGVVSDTYDPLRGALTDRRYRARRLYGLDMSAQIRLSSTENPPGHSFDFLQNFESSLSRFRR
jgi:DNA-binding transcriptional MocR family regulator